MSELMSEHPVAIVTGASRGIGRAVAAGLAQDGYLVALVARDAGELEKLCRELEDGPTPPRIRPRIFSIDITDQAALACAVRDLDSEAGRIDLLFNNAAIVRRGTSDLDIADLEAMWRTNLVAPINLIHLVAPIMKRQRSGHVINVASRSARFPKAKNGGYAATKAALAAFAGALYLELAQHNIKVTTILPSYVDTSQSAGQTWLDDLAKIRPNDILKTVRFLVSLSDSVAVQEIVLDCAHVVAFGEQYV